MDCFDITLMFYKVTIVVSDFIWGIKKAAESFTFIMFCGRIVV